jgi:hypothetical protein
VKRRLEMVAKTLRMYGLRGFTLIETSAKRHLVPGFSEVSLPPKPLNYYYSAGLDREVQRY